MMKSGKNIGLYLPGEVYGYIAEDARVRGIPVTTWVRNAVLAACPPGARAELAEAQRPAKRRGPAPKAKQPATKPGRQAAPPKVPQDMPAQSRAGKQEPVSFAALVERHRDRVLDLEARGHLPNAICSITRLEYKVVAQILSTRAIRKETCR
jgi:hypothetical protein